MIILAAIKVNDELIISMPRPNRHGDIIRKAIATDMKIDKQECGFLNDNGDFLDRIEGYEHALKEKQILPGHCKCLISEDLW